MVNLYKEWNKLGLATSSFAKYFFKKNPFYEIKNNPVCWVLEYSEIEEKSTPEEKSVMSHEVSQCADRVAWDFRKALLYRDLP